MYKTAPTGRWGFAYPLTMRPARRARPCALHFPGLARIGMEGRLRAGQRHVDEQAQGIWQPTGPKGYKLAKFQGRRLREISETASTLAR